MAHLTRRISHNYYGIRYKKSTHTQTPGKREIAFLLDFKMGNHNRAHTISCMTEWHYRFKSGGGLIMELIWKNTKQINHHVSFLRGKIIIFFLFFFSPRTSAIEIHLRWHKLTHNGIIRSLTNLYQWIRYSSQTACKVRSSWLF